MRRFVVQTVTGYAKDTARHGRSQGLSAHVCDSLVLYRVVGSFRSESRLPVFGARTLGATGAIEAAQALAERLNRDEA